MSDLQWTRDGHDHGAALARDLAYTPVYLHYNSGLHVSVNGRVFAEQLESLVQRWPVPLTELVLIGHSMGGLVARSACHYAAVARHQWLQRVDKLVFIRHAASRGAARAGRQLGRRVAEREPVLRSIGAPRQDPQRRHHRFAVRQPRRRRLESARSLRARRRSSRGGAAAESCGVLRDCRVHGEDGRRSRGPVAWRRRRAAGQRARSPRDPELALAFADSWVAYGTNHLDLLSRPEVYEDQAVAGSVGLSARIRLTTEFDPFMPFVSRSDVQTPGCSGLLDSRTKKKSGRPLKIVGGPRRNRCRAPVAGRVL